MLALAIAFRGCNPMRTEDVFRGQSGEGTPGSIPNPEVKLSSADGTARETVWESRSLRNLNSMIAALYGRLSLFFRVWLRFVGPVRRHA